MCKVPRVLLEVSSREFAEVMLEGVNRLLSVLAESCKGNCTDRESCLPAKLELMLRVPSKIRSPEVDVVRFPTVFPLSLSLRVVNSKLSGTGLMCRVPAESLEVKSRELAPVTLLGFQSVLMLLEFIWRGKVALTVVELSRLVT